MMPRIPGGYPHSARLCRYPPHPERVLLRAIGKSAASPGLRERTPGDAATIPAYLAPFSAAAISLLASAIAFLIAPATHGTSPSVVLG